MKRRKFIVSFLFFRGVLIWMWQICSSCCLPLYFPKDILSATVLSAMHPQKHVCCACPSFRVTEAFPQTVKVALHWQLPSSPGCRGDQPPVPSHPYPRGFASGSGKTRCFRKCDLMTEKNIVILEMVSLISLHPSRKLMKPILLQQKKGSWSPLEKGRTKTATGHLQNKEEADETAQYRST